MHETPPASAPSVDETVRARRKWVAHGLSNRFIYGGTAWGCARLPMPVLRSISWIGNEIAIRLMDDTVAGVVENFRIAFGWSDAESKRMARRLFHTYGISVIELFRVQGGGSVPRVTTYEQDSRALQAVLSSGKGCLIVTGHVGNWEMGGMSLLAHGVRGAVVGQPELDPRVQEIRLEVRSRLGVETIDIGTSMSTAFKVRDAVSRGLAVAMVADRAYLEDHVEVEFFGRPTPFLRSPALLARFADCPILPSFFLRNPDGTYRSHFGEPLFADRTISPEEDSYRVMSEVARVVERAIREEPHQWYNFFSFWSTPLSGH